MPRTTTCRACGYTLTFPDDPIERVTICPRCNRFLSEHDEPGVVPLMLRGVGMTIFGITVVLVTAFCLGTLFFSRISDGPHDEAALKAQNIQKACLAFNMSRGRLPESLDELVTPSEGKLPMLEGGEAAILDPWQQRYQFDVTDGPDGTKRAKVWTTTPEGKRIQWPRE